MVRKIKNLPLDFSDYLHKYSQWRGPWNTNHKEKTRHADFVYPHNGTDVTIMNHLPPPSHAYDPKLLNAPDPYFGREGCDVTEYMRAVNGCKPGPVYWYGREKTDVTEHLKQHIPCVVNPLGDIFWGRPKSYVTDPSISPNLTPPGRPLDGEGSKYAMTWPAKSKEDQIPLGKPVSKLQNMLNALERSQRKPAPIKPSSKGPAGPSKKRSSPGYPVGKSGKEFPPPGLKIKIPVFDSTYWGRTKSYITDYAISPNLTSPGRPLDGEAARVAMTFVPITPQVEDKIPLGKAVNRIGSPRPFSPSSGAPQLQTGLGGPTNRLKPRPHPLSPSAKSPPKSPPSKSPLPKSPEQEVSSSSKGKVATPTSKAPSKSPASPASSGVGSCKSKNQGNLRWRDQSDVGSLTSQCCEKKQPRGPPFRPTIASITCSRPGSTAPKRKAMNPNFKTKIITGQLSDPHHDVPWHGRMKNYVTDPSISPNLTPPGRQSHRTPAEKAASLARRPPKVPMIQPFPKPQICKIGQKN